MDGAVAVLGGNVTHGHLGTGSRTAALEARFGGDEEGFRGGILRLVSSIEVTVPVKNWSRALAWVDWAGFCGKEGVVALLARNASRMPEEINRIISE